MKKYKLHPGKKHKWMYGGGICRCELCGKYMQPDGKITTTPTGRKKKKTVKWHGQTFKG